VIKNHAFTFLTDASTSASRCERGRLAAPAGSAEPPEERLPEALMRDGISQDALVEEVRRVLEERAAGRPGRLVSVHELDAATLILEP
jgi:hypothetical protein